MEGESIWCIGRVEVKHNGQKSNIFITVGQGLSPTRWQHIATQMRGVRYWLSRNFHLNCLHTGRVSGSRHVLDISACFFSGQIHILRMERGSPLLHRVVHQSHCPTDIYHTSRHPTMKCLLKYPCPVQILPHASTKDSSTILGGSQRALMSSPCDLSSWLTPYPISS